MSWLRTHSKTCRVKSGILAIAGMFARNFFCACVSHIFMQNHWGNVGVRFLVFQQVAQYWVYSPPLITCSLHAHFQYDKIDRCHFLSELHASLFRKKIVGIKWNSFDYFAACIQIHYYYINMLSQVILLTVSYSAVNSWYVLYWLVRVGSLCKLITSIDRRIDLSTP